MPPPERRANAGNAAIASDDPRNPNGCDSMYATLKQATSASLANALSENTPTRP
jgi:hypothetical protein